MQSTQCGRKKAYFVGIPERPKGQKLSLSCRIQVYQIMQSFNRYRAICQYDICQGLYPYCFTLQYIHILWPYLLVSMAFQQYRYYGEQSYIYYIGKRGDVWVWSEICRYIWGIRSYVIYKDIDIRVSIEQLGVIFDGFCGGFG